jgi:hypothetical protein
MKRVWDNKEYVHNNGEERRRKHISSIDYVTLNNSEYIFRPVNHNYNGIQVPPLFFIQQLNKIGKWLDVKYLTLNNLFFSGMVEKAVKIYHETGEEPTAEQFLAIVQEADWGETAELQIQYSHKLRRLCRAYMVPVGE